MKIILLLFFLISACSFFNDREVAVPISSNPSGAGIYINGIFKGQTPSVIRLDPRENLNLTLTKEGYNNANILMETWYSARENRPGGDRTRCVLDSLGIMMIVPAIALYQGCKDFKQESYVADLYPTNGAGNFGANSGLPYYYGGGQNQQQKSQNNYQNYDSSYGAPSQ